MTNGEAKEAERWLGNEQFTLNHENAINIIQYTNMNQSRD